MMRIPRMHGIDVAMPHVRAFIILICVSVHFTSFFQDSRIMRVLVGVKRAVDYAVKIRVSPDKSGTTFFCCK
jgi:hypothetical protein